MSTPSTAVATLPQYPQHRQFQPPFTSHYKLEHYSSPTLAATSSKDLPPPHSPASRYLPYYQSAASAASPSDGVAHAQSSVPPRPPPHVYLESSSSNAAIHHHPGDSISSTMTSATMTAVDSHSLDQSTSKKRRRDSHGPDWNHFYRNGLPEEVIVIDDDTPEPEANTSRRITNGTSAQILPHDASRGQPAKKRRRDDEQRPGYHIQYLHSHTGTPQYNTTPLGSRISSDHASLTTTAPTSLSSTSLHDDVPAPLKRKRTTRQQAADEAKRRDVDGLGDPVMTYMPPPYPPKKAGEVTVRVVSDVSCAFFYHHFFWLLWWLATNLMADFANPSCRRLAHTKRASRSMTTTAIILSSLTLISLKDVCFFSLCCILCHSCSYAFFFRSNFQTTRPRHLWQGGRSPRPTTKQGRGRENHSIGPKVSRCLSYRTPSPRYSSGQR